MQSAGSKGHVNVFSVFIHYTSALLIVKELCALVLFYCTDAPMPVKLKVNASGAKGNTFTLTWVEPNNNGAVVLDYMVYKRDVNETSEWKFVAPAVPASNLALTEYVITLQRGKTFDLVVTAKNKFGESVKEEDNVKRVKVSRVSEGKFLIVIKKYLKLM